MPRNLFIGILVHLAGYLTAQTFNVVHYGVGNGLPTSSLGDMYLDSRSVLWLASETAGILSYDGTGFRREFQHDLHTGLQWMGEDSEGALLCVTGSKLLRYDGLRIKQTELKLRDFGKTASLVAIPGGTYIGIQSGLYVLKASVASGLVQLLAEPVLALTDEHPYFSAWTQTARFIYKKSTGELVRTHLIKHLSKGNLRQVYGLGEGQAVLIYNDGAIVKVLEDGAEVLLEVNFQTVSSVAEGENGTLYIAEPGRGVHVVNAEGYEVLTLDRSTGLVSEKVTDLLFDHSGQLWISTSDRGLMKLAGNRIIKAKLGFQPADIAFDSNRSLWAFDADGRLSGVSLHKGPSFSSKINSGGGTLDAFSIAADPFGNIWIFTREGYLVVLPLDGVANPGDSNVRSIDLDSAALRMPFGRPNLPDVVPESSGMLFDAFSNVYLWIHPGQLWHVHPQMPGTFPGLPVVRPYMEMPDDAVPLHIDLSGRVWFARQGRLEVASPGNQGVQIPEVHAPVSVVEDQEGQIWVGSRSGGVFRIDWDTDETVRARLVTRLLQIPGELYTIAVVDRDMWVAKGTYLARLSPPASRIGLIVQSVFGPHEGFVPGDILEGAKIKALPDGSGILLSAGKEIFTIRQSLHDQNVDPVSPFFEDIRIGNKPIETTAFSDALGARYTQLTDLEFPPSRNNILFKVNVSSISGTTKPTLEYMLERTDTTWTGVSSAGEIAFSNLGAGAYALHVRACSNTGRCTEMEAPFRFQIAPYFWQRTWVQVFAACLLLSSGFWYGQRRRKMRERRLIAEKNAIQTQAKLLEIEQKALTLQMNPHFLFNVLQTIRGRMLSGETDLAGDALQGFSKLVRKVLEHARRPQVALEAEIDLLEEYIRLEQFYHPSGFTSGISLEDDMEPDAIMIPPMLIQPFVENAIHHGIGSAKDGVLSLQFQTVGDCLMVSIRDNGPGFTPDGMAGNGKSVALTLVRERLDLLGGGGEFSIKSGNDIREGQSGTTVLLKIPLKNPEFQPLKS